MFAALSPTGIHITLLSLENNIPRTHCSVVNKQQSLSQKWFRCKPSICSMKLSSLVEVLDKLKKQTIEINMVIKVQ
jgi:hypothetical protein